MIKRWLCPILAFVVLVGIFPLTGRVQAASTMTSSDELVAYIKTMEGFRAYPYSDYGQYSVGYGTKCPSDKYNEYCQNGISEADAVALLKNELVKVESALNSFAAKHGLTWKQHQFDALVSFSFNVGTGWLSETDGNMYNAVLSGDTGNRLIYSIGLWSTAGGEFVLLERRLSEANLYINGAYTPYNGTATPFPDSYRWVFLNGNGGTVRYRVWCYDSASPVTPEVLFTEYPKDANGNACQFAGWYTADGKHMPQFDATLTRGQTLYAAWRDADGSINAPSGNKNHSVSVSVTGTSVRIRSGAGTGYSHVRYTTKGEVLNITEVQTADGYTWGKCPDGWIALEYTSFASTSGWLKENSRLAYYEKGAKVKNAWRFDGDQECLLDGNGYRVTNRWVTDSAGWLYLDSQGYITRNAWAKDTVGWCWLKEDGRIATSQWVSVDGKQYYCNSSGYRVIGTQIIGGITHRFDGNGVLLTEFTVSFVDWDGTVLQTGYYACGDTVTPPAAPVREDTETCTYTFIGWTPEVTAVTGNTTYTATYETKEILLPEILQQPQAVTAPSGENVQFRVVTQGDVVSYRWEYRSIYKWFSTTMEGCNTDTLNVPATAARHGYDYHCVVTFADGTELISEPAELTVQTTVTITGQPNDQAVCLGYKGQFTVAAEGENLKYQWQYRRPDGTKWIDTAMEGCTKPTVMIETTAARNGYQYRCKVFDATGNTVYSEPATMSVLSFTKQPVSVTAKAGNAVTFTVTTSLQDGFTYQWQYSRNGETWSNTNMAGCNTNTLTVSVTAARNGYQYRCVLTGAKNSKVISKTATLTVN